MNNIFTQQQEFFNSGATQSYAFRIAQLNKLRNVLVQYTPDIIQALYADLHRPEFEAYFEIELIKEIDYAIKNLASWMKPRHHLPSMAQLPGLCYSQPQALGMILIISPWNYPFELTFRPLIGAIAAGNCAMIKPSEIATNSSKLIKQIIETVFTPEYIAVREGGADVTHDLLQLRFKHIFFTGSTAVGKIVASEAAKSLTPVTLELGGKSPVIVCRDADLYLAARRILWGKLINAGQTCIAPDYVLVAAEIYDKFVVQLQLVLAEFGDYLSANKFGHIISDKHWQRLVNFIVSSKIIAGGNYDKTTKYIEPTIVAVDSYADVIMQEEIFGPILPLLKFSNLTDEIKRLQEMEQPLALYLFSHDKTTQDTIQLGTISGGMAINDCVLHISNHRTKFGGVGNSGSGGYHGKHSFDLFTHHKTVLKRFKFELPWRYAPYNWLKLWFIKVFTSSKIKV